MRVLVQRSKESSVKIGNKVVGKIDHGFVLLVGFTHTDNNEIVEKMVHKLLNLRVFEDEEEKMNMNIVDTKGQILSISQFTLYASTTHGNRPSFIESMKYNEASLLYDYFNKCLKNKGIKVETGEFGANMEVSITNDGPVTIMLDSES